jgi:organic radical activating enzyme
MATLHYTELFYSIQGEGRYMGVPSVFLRTFGCNFRCKGFGRKPSDVNKDDSNPEVERFIMAVKNNPEKYRSFRDLPLVTTGCDTYSSVYPEFKQFVTKSDTNTVVDEIVELLPYKTWCDEHLVITGGEPLLGWQKSYIDLLEHDKMKALKELTFETNGTQTLNSDFKEYLKKWTKNKGYNKLTFSVSPKLSVSGENIDESIKPEVIFEYEDIGHTYLKFVIATEQDADEAMMCIDRYRDHGFTGDVYLMPVGGIPDIYALNNRNVAELAMNRGLRYSDRLQVPLFKNAWGT